MDSILYFLIGFLIMSGIYSVFSVGLNIHWGHTGLFNIGIASFFLLGSYAAAIISSPPPSIEKYEDYLWGGNLSQLTILGFDIWFPIILILSAIICALVAIPLAFITIRLKEDYLALVTLGLAETLRIIFVNESWLANGTRGLYSIPRPFDFIDRSNYDYIYFVVVMITLFIVYIIAERATNSPWGRVLRGIKDNENTMISSGKNVLKFKVEAFAFGAGIMGIGGALFTHGKRFIDPITFEPMLATFIIWSMLMVGGSGNNRGAIFGAFLMWGIWTFTQFLPGFLSDANLRFVFVGMIIIIFQLYKPKGVIPAK
tara:strand:- start:117 stop:1058 length:942 start_codon:yes stop_codon:yes gene_type:complete